MEDNKGKKVRICYTEHVFFYLKGEGEIEFLEK